MGPGAPRGRTRRRPSARQAGAAGRAQLMEHLGAGTLRLLHEPLSLPEEGRRIVVHLPA
ncbi:hypothetical protein PV415_21405 [Streptomyces sp. ME03-5684b]|uniref:hypothetical protein n=1 Tax=unclassified Streptomyces TaxID=2593676 RepID=UPI0029BEF326|nr:MULTISPECIES: hypothetical protein [unclassified Streptomyces]MDX3319469.1 hypothetical protein [Streptomyces sp. ME03-5684b]MDX3401110.1 hypothetical protein [Streptomyces sp. ME01-18h]